MIKYIGLRLLHAIPVLLGISLVAFLLGIIMPGDPAEIALSAQGAYTPTQKQIEIQREKMGLNKSYPEQYSSWLKNVLKGDLGTSYSSKAPVKYELGRRIFKTVQLSLLSMAATVFVGIPIGVFMAIYQNRFFDHMQQFLSVVYVSVPGFWLAIILISIFSENLHILPTSGVGGFKYLVMPTIVLSISTIGTVSRLIRASILNEMEKQYIVAAKSKGISNFKIHVRHAFKNSLIPVIAMLGSNFGSILGGSVIVESVFAINGLGKFAMDSINLRDYPALQGYVLITGLVFVIVNLAVDLLYYFLNPAIRVGEKNG